MKIELIIDENCISVNSFIDTVNRLTQEFSDLEINIISFEDDRKRLKNLGIHMLPVWIINNNVIRIRPDDYQALKEKIIARL
jgi:hypothetical protein